jgi:hypothetical protein
LVNNKIIFKAANQGSFFLYTTNGSSSGTVAVKDSIDANQFFRDPDYIIPYNGGLMFSAESSLKGFELCKYRLFLFTEADTVHPNATDRGLSEEIDLFLRNMYF